MNKGYASLIKSNLEIDPRMKGKQNERINAKYLQ